MQYKYPFILSDKVPFPKRAPDSFPLVNLLDGYLLNLIPVSPVHSEFVALIFKRIGLEASKTLLARFSLERYSASLLEQIELADSISDLVRCMEKMGKDGFAPTHEHALRKYLSCALRAVKENEHTRPVDYIKKMKRVGNGLDLSFPEIEILEFCICYQVSLDFMHFCDQFITADWPYLISEALGYPPDTIYHLLGGDKGLLNKGLLEFTTRDMDVHKPLLNYLVGLNSDFIEPGLCTRFDKAHYPLESFPVPKVELDLIERMLKTSGSSHLLFYGRPGTGKTELAKTLALEAGYEPCLLACGMGGNQQDRTVAITSALAMASEKSLFILDEADSLLNTMQGYYRKEVDKSWVNHFLDTCPHKVIWITNDVTEIPTSVLRRFAYSLRFDKFTFHQRCCTWKTQLKEKKLTSALDDQAIKRLSRKFQTDAGAIASAVEITSRLYEGQTPRRAETEAVLENFLNHHLSLSGLKEPRMKAGRESSTYDPKALNTDMPPAVLLDGLLQYDVNRQSKFLHPAAALFWGLPGTGKTQFAKYLAETLERPLVQKRMSDLQSKYVGETEKNIAAAFREAEDQQAVLLLDEVESLILDRRTAHRSWESSQTNEILTQLESFHGICICCTNLVTHVDHAALRRFTWKVEFRPLTPEGRERLYRCYFQPGGGRLSNLARTRLQKMSRLTPGDFKVVYQQMKLRGGTGEPSGILNALEREQSYKDREDQNTIGFHLESPTEKQKG